MRCSLLIPGLLVAVSTTPALAQLNVSVDSYTPGHAAFVAQCGQAGVVTLFDWSTFPDQASHVAHQLDPQRAQHSWTQPGTNDTITSRTRDLVLANWIDAPGFGLPSAPAADLAVNDKESFDLSLDHPVALIGFAISTGKTNAAKSQVDSRGARFRLIAKDAADALIGTAEFDVGPGAKESWVTITAARPITFLTVEEIGTSRYPASITDQYFSNLFTCGEAR